ncbi:MAG TPA: histidine phosphatase family protein [Actinomycetales bacterium]|nr:histidine phosphatase family protein [Actinomycetales bacterium]
MTASTVILWRHGQTTFNAESRWQGQLDAPLDEEGVAQAGSAATELVTRKPTRIVSSDLRRAVLTARALGERTGLEVALDPGLREVHAGDWQGLVRAEIEARWPAEYAAWRRGDDIAIGGGERRSEVGARAAAAVAKHADACEDGAVLVVASHGMALRMALLNLLGIPASAWSALGSLGNTHWATLGNGRSGWFLAEYNVGPPGARRGVEG